MTEYFDAKVIEDAERIPDRWESSFNIAPTTNVPVVRLNKNGERVLLIHRWGLIPSWANDASIGAKLNNARGETVHEKPSFRAAFKRFRCLIPMTGYYEWQSPPEGEKGTKRPYYIRHPSHPYLAVAGVCDHWKDPAGNLIFSTAVITTRPSNDIAHIHDRMPVMINRMHWEFWLDSKNQNVDELRDLLEPYDGLQFHRVGLGVSAAGKNRIDDPSLIIPLQDPD